MSEQDSAAWEAYYKTKVQVWKDYNEGKVAAMKIRDEAWTAYVETEIQLRKVYTEAVDQAEKIRDEAMTQNKEEAKREE